MGYRISGATASFYLPQGGEVIKAILDAFVNILLFPICVVYGIYVIVTATRYEKELYEHIADPIPYYTERCFETDFWLRENGLK